MASSSYHENSFSLQSQIIKPIIVFILFLNPMEF